MAIRIGARRAAIATLALVSVANVALAEDDGGVHAFLANEFGQAGVVPRIAALSAENREPRPNATDDRSPALRHHTARSRSLTVRRQFPMIAAAASPSKPAKVSIYMDPTLRAGDAVMTADGIRVFAGSRSWPYLKSDFVPIAQAHDLTRDTVKILADLNSPPTI